ncbi:hypothetical protein RFI_38681 [Reticulomyxa filosa]|uniref:Uncharacterized protein n=1 Tax=Reticulomyxa filosa TaxID=46433 RepID=X6LCF8_RETFI|nr:hypothetical protein RFI_38681 [Reticulomyxa filosa]|eukprot:ETN98806.1 hypothetical protein RFI_38681 [Reticulomyxa filosa]
MKVYLFEEECLQKYLKQSNGKCPIQQHNIIANLKNNTKYIKKKEEFENYQYVIHFRKTSFSCPTCKKNHSYLIVYISHYQSVIINQIISQDLQMGQVNKEIMNVISRDIFIYVYWRF